MKTYTDAELASIAAKKLSQLLGYDNGEPFKSPNGTYWSLGSGNNHFFSRDETGEPQVWCRYPQDHTYCRYVKKHLLRLLEEPCECEAPWCAACTAEVKVIHQRSLEAEADFIARSLDTEAPPV